MVGRREPTLAAPRHTHGSPTQPPTCIVEEVAAHPAARSGGPQPPPPRPGGVEEAAEPPPQPGAPRPIGARRARRNCRPNLRTLAPRQRATGWRALQLRCGEYVRPTACVCFAAGAALQPPHVCGPHTAESVVPDAG